MNSQVHQTDPGLIPSIPKINPICIVLSPVLGDYPLVIPKWHLLLAPNRLDGFLEPPPFSGKIKNKSRTCCFIVKYCHRNQKIVLPMHVLSPRGEG